MFWTIQESDINKIEDVILVTGLTVIHYHAHLGRITRPSDLVTYCWRSFLWLHGKFTGQQQDARSLGLMMRPDDYKFYVYIFNLLYRE